MQNNSSYKQVMKQLSTKDSPTPRKKRGFKVIAKYLLNEIEVL